MIHFEIWQYILLALIFIWTGCIGFGGAALSLPFLLLDKPLFWLPIIAWHLLFFSSITVSQRLHQVDWRFLRYTHSILIIPKMIGIFGLLNLPNNVLVIIVYCIILFYAITYIFNITRQSHNRLGDIVLLILGGYMSGTSLIGSPLIVAVYMRHVELQRLRDTLFVLWFILVSFKMSAFVVTGVDLQWEYTLLLLPFAAIGHYFGLKAHVSLIAAQGNNFKRIIGIVLALVIIIGLWSILY
ncbi:hypothetical protein PN36_22650 [Candidatus Thiomargarita nelsonii]|uniref:Probable membrane transporter protein n=1 Tax=Candidatus Thiomargarita nelsonii TaxID=1003181 RepID=A0A0A6P7A6_9GAMM|nr:hypothetical protein PN36_22650 [Candidatus Thiomargarita nelsonii]